jgi:hypothetical protein
MHAGFLVYFYSFILWLRRKGRNPSCYPRRSSAQVGELSAEGFTEQQCAANLSSFWHYFEKTWGPGAKFQPSFWNVHRFRDVPDHVDSVLINRTNKKINSKIKQSSPNMVDMINVLKTISNEYMFMI